MALVRHHLRAFGPAAREDVASWIGAPRPADVQPTLDVLAPDLVTFRDEAGRLLYDDRCAAAGGGGGAAAAVPGLVRQPAAGLRAAVSGRILQEAHRALVIRQGNLQILPTYLVDGMVAGTWRIEAAKREAAVVLQPFEPLTRADRRGLQDEGERLAGFLRPEAAVHGVRFEER
jgi:winged helix DNA-binding protein